MFLYINDESILPDHRSSVIKPCVFVCPVTPGNAWWIASIVGFLRKKIRMLFAKGLALA